MRQTHNCTVGVWIVMAIIASIALPATLAEPSLSSPSATKRSYKNFLRFGRGGDIPLSDLDIPIEEAFGSYASPDVSFIDGPADPALMMMDKKNGRNFIRFGRGKNFLRFGRGPANFIRFGRSVGTDEFEQPNVIGIEADASKVDDKTVSGQSANEMGQHTNGGRAKRSLPNLVALVHGPPAFGNWPDDAGAYLFGESSGTSSEEIPPSAFFELQKRGFHRNVFSFGQPSPASPDVAEDGRVASHRNNFVRFG